MLDRMVDFFVSTTCHNLRWIVRADSTAQVLCERRPLRGNRGQADQPPPAPPPHPDGIRWRVFEQFLNDARRPLDYLPGGDLIGDSVGEDVDSAHSSRSQKSGDRSQNVERVPSDYGA